ncbi:MAG: hypothetical protein HUK20_11125 [Fibrobacter sp.]|nr:hypothetical protein [Fibrobacter sp.]
MEQSKEISPEQDALRKALNLAEIVAESRGKTVEDVAADALVSWYYQSLNNLNV